MKWSIRLARVAGIDLKIHFTFLLFLVWIAASYYRSGGRGVAIEGTLFVVLLFLCVLLHELGHALVARCYGIHTPDITLLPIGGVARLERIPREPREELLIAVAGPAVNVVIAAGLVLALHQRGSLSDLQALSTPGLAMAVKLAWVNIFLVLFNLIPAFPMDGGRVLRAFLAMKLDYVRATQIAGAIGRSLAVVFALVGLVWNPMLIFIGLFVYLGATQETALASMTQLSESMPVSEAMATHLESLAATATLGEAAATVLRTLQHEFPVVNENQKVVGVLTRMEILRALSQHGDDTPISQAIRRPVLALRPEDHLDEAMAKLRQNGYPALPVTNAFGQVIGMITPDSVAALALIKKGPRGAWPLAHA